MLGPHTHHLRRARRLVACNHQRAIDFYTASIYHHVVPRAFLCEDFDSFQAGHCAECGSTGERCITLGPQTVSQRQSYARALGESGKRFFLLTDGKSPYFSECPYILPHCSHYISTCATQSISWLFALRWRHTRTGSPTINMARSDWDCTNTRVIRTVLTTSPSEYIP